MKFSEIPQFTHSCYKCDLPLNYLLHALKRYQEKLGLNLNPDFQRPHVWTTNQQIAYVEFFLKAPQSGLDIYTNNPEWQRSYKGEFVLVDGKQRLEALTKFLNNEIPAYGCYYKDYTDKNSLSTLCIHFHVARLQTKAEILQWYLDFNSGGTVHTKEELEKVQTLLKKERKNHANSN